MFSSESSPVSPLPNPPTAVSHKKLYALIGTLVAVFIVAAALLIPQVLPFESTPATVQEHMVYQTTNIVTSQMVNASLDLPAATTTQ